MVPEDRELDPRDVAPDFAALKQPVRRLHLRGRLPDPARPRVTMVGTRRASRQGTDAAFTMARTLAQAGVVVVSGMARGIDTAAHEGALAGGGPTVAFIGCGLNRISPPAAQRLAARIAERGAVLTEYPADYPAGRYTFVARNRLLAAYTAGTVVVEAGEKSGALITADFALDLGRMVWGVPGDVGRANTRGSNRLIRDGAIVALNGADILVSIGFRRNHESAFEPPELASLGPEPQRIVRTLAREGTVDVESLHRLTALPVAALLAAVSALEVAGHVVRVPGGFALRRT